MKLLIYGFLIVQSIIKFNELLQHGSFVIVHKFPNLLQTTDTSFSIFTKFRRENRAAMSTILPIMFKVIPERTHYSASAKVADEEPTKVPQPRKQTLD